MKKLQGELQREEGGKASLENTCLLLEHPARRHAGCRRGVTLNAGHDGRGLWREGGLPRQAFGTVGLLLEKRQLSGTRSTWTVPVGRAQRWRTQ